MQEIIWTTWDGRDIPITKLTHQHLSNIIHFMTHVNTKYPIRTQNAMQDELRNRFNGSLLPYMPCADFTEEIDFLKNSGYLVASENIGQYDIIVKGKKIGFYDISNTCAA
jgi:hypothetical protein